MEREERTDRFTAIEDLYVDYQVYDRDGEKIGKVDDLFVDEHDNPEYLGVKTGLFGISSTLVPWEMVRVDEGRGSIEISDTKDHVKNGPNFNDDKDITPEFEERVYSHFGLQRAGATAESGAYGAYYRGNGYAAGLSEREERHPGVTMGDLDREDGKFHEHPPSPEYEGVSEHGSDLKDEDELRVQRTEEELIAGTREREAGSVNVRKRVRTDREQIAVPKRREEVHVDRIPVEGREASEAEIGEEEVYMPVTEEEVVVEKRPQVKEEIRVRKDIAREEELVEEDVRREEVDVEDHTERGRGPLGQKKADIDETKRYGR